jgi:ATP-binding cassette subfamily B (MDR/TAP) protein 1
VLFSVIIAATSITSIGPHFIVFARAASAAKELFTLIDRESGINPFGQLGRKPNNPSGAISLQGISFSYPTRPNVTVLENFTLDIPPGKVTALVVSAYWSRPKLGQEHRADTQKKRGQVVRGKVLSSVC